MFVCFEAKIQFWANFPFFQVWQMDGGKWRVHILTQGEGVMSGEQATALFHMSEFEQENIVNEVMDFLTYWSEEGTPPEVLNCYCNSALGKEPKEIFDVEVTDPHGHFVGVD